MAASGGVGEQASRLPIRRPERKLGPLCARERACALRVERPKPEPRWILSGLKDHIAAIRRDRQRSSGREAHFRKRSGWTKRQRRKRNDGKRQRRNRAESDSHAVSRRRAGRLEVRRPRWFKRPHREADVACVVKTSEARADDRP